MERANQTATKSKVDLPALKLRGQSAVEFALAGTVLIVLLFGVLEVGRLIYINSEVQNAAREGAQIAAFNPSIQPAALATRVVSKMVVTDHNTVTVTGPCFVDSSGTCTGTACPYCKVRVSVTAQWTSFVSFVPSVTLPSSSVKLIEAGK